MRLWCMVCALCKDLRRLWHEAAEATNFFRWISRRLLFFRFRLEPHPHPFFCHVFVVGIFFSERLLTSEVKTDENLDRPEGSPKKTGRGKNMLACLCHKYPTFFFFKGILRWKKNLSTPNSKCSIFLIEKMLILFVWFFFGGWKVAAVNDRATDRSSQDILWEEMVFWGEESPGSWSILQENFLKDSHRSWSSWVLNPSFSNRERWPNTKQTPKKTNAIWIWCYLSNEQKSKLFGIYRGLYCWCVRNPAGDHHLGCINDFSPCK